jgi:hypothetical protein
MRTTVIILFTMLIAGCSQSQEVIEENAAATQAAPSLPEVKPGPNTLFVDVERVQRRTCPNITCGDVGWIAERQVVEALERRDGWVRITKTYDAACRDGRSEYVDDGKASCTPDNGIVDGKFAEWVPMSALSKTRPADPAATASGDEAMIAQSDDFKRYRSAFLAVSNRLISEGRCTKADFTEMGGWLKSVNEHKNEPVYFTYCGGMTSANKIYMNAKTKTLL